MTSAIPNYFSMIFHNICMILMTITSIYGYFDISTKTFSKICIVDNEFISQYKSYPGFKDFIFLFSLIEKNILDGGYYMTIVKKIIFYKNEMSNSNSILIKNSDSTLDNFNSSVSQISNSLINKKLNYQTMSEIPLKTIKKCKNFKNNINIKSILKTKINLINVLENSNLILDYFYQKNPQFSCQILETLEIIAKKRLLFWNISENILLSQRLHQEIISKKNFYM